MMDTKITTESAIKKLATLATKRDVWLASLDDVSLGAILFSASQAIATNESLDEKTLTQRLQSWLDSTGSMLRIDRVELRRTLIDFQWIARDDFGRAYTRAMTSPARFRDVIVALEATDIASTIQTARREFEAERTARKLAHQQKMPSTG
jgi:Uncharacterized protein conserved in bacteria (DUF2087)